MTLEHWTQIKGRDLDRVDADIDLIGSIWEVKSGAIPRDELPQFNDAQRNFLLSGTRADASRAYSYSALAYERLLKVQKRVNLLIVLAVLNLIFALM